MSIARCRLCKDAVYNYRHRLCLRHYNRAKERRRLTKGALTWESIIANPDLLNGNRVHLTSAPRHLADDEQHHAQASRSCLLCANLIPIPPLKSLACDKNQFGATFRFISIDSVERGGIPPHLVGRAKTCPFFRMKP